MKNNVFIFFLFIFLSVIVNGQYLIIEEFNSFGGVGEWTINNGGSTQNYGGAENYLSFNLADRECPRRPKKRREPRFFLS